MMQVVRVLDGGPDDVVIVNFLNCDNEADRDRSRRGLLARQDEIRARRDVLIEQLERKLERQVEESTLLVCEWELE